MTLRGTDLLSIKHVSVRQRAALRTMKLTGVSTDSRTIAPGNLYVALKGESFDGHGFVAEAFAKGAAAAIVAASFDASALPAHAFIVVRDTVAALGELAAIYRKKFRIPVIAVAGSNGKTTTKEMIAAVLASQYSVLKTEGNLNNHIGVPQTIFRLDKSHDVAVIEIGTNHPGELKYLCSMLHPIAGVITNIGREHLEFFGTLEGVAREEGELFETLRHIRGATAFVNQDDPAVVTLAKKLHRTVTFGFGGTSPFVAGSALTLEKNGCARFRFRAKRMRQSVQVRLSIPGAHNASNALAAAAIALWLKITPAEIKKSLEAFRPASKRMELISIGGVTIYNDAYNANPDSMIAALKTLAGTTITGKKIAVLGDMRELGDHAEEEHARVGREATAAGLEYLLTFGEKARYIHDAADVPFAVHYDQKNMLAEYLAELIGPGDAVLVKGSRGMKMEDVVTFLVERRRAVPAV